jgi:hypothetical protein
MTRTRKKKRKSIPAMKKKLREGEKFKKEVFSFEYSVGSKNEGRKRERRRFKRRR